MTGAGHAERVRERYDSIQILRGVAALMVLVFHIPFYVAFPREPLLPLLYGGVDLFFVISGFIMVVATGRDRGDPIRFARKRIVRIVPLYWLVTGAVVVIALLGPEPNFALADILRSLLFIPYHNPRVDDVQPVLNVGWTLNLEVVFYLAFALTMRLPAWRQVAAILALFLLLIALRVAVRPDPHSVLFFLTSPLLLEFVMGMALALSVSRLRRLSAGTGAVLVALGVAGALVGELALALPRTLGLGLPAVLVCAGAVIVEAHRPLEGLRGLRRLGDASYSLYLTHPVVLGLLMPLGLLIPWWLAGALMAATAMAVGFAVFRWVETPLLQRLGWNMKRRQIAPAT